MSSRNKKPQEVLSFVYNVWISGTELGIDKKSCINSIDIKETVVGSDIATIKISDPEFVFIEDDIFVQDNKIKIKFGLESSTYRNTFDGYISAIDISFPETGVPSLVLTCMDNTHVMNRKKKSNTFKNCTRADVVKKVVSSYGFKCVIDSSYKFTKEETITQSNQTDIDFIQKLASDEVYPFTARLVGDTFYYVKKGKLGSSVMTLTYQKYPHTIKTFDAKINKESKKIEVSKAKVDTSSKKVTSSKSSTNTGDGSASASVPTTKVGTGYTYAPDKNSWNKVTIT